MTERDDKLGEFYNTLYLPYTGMCLSFIIIGAYAAKSVDLFLLALTLLAYFLGLGIASHMVDQLAGKPWGHRMTDNELKMIIAVSLIGAFSIGAYGVLLTDYPLIIFMAPAGFFVFAYNFEWGPRSPKFGLYKGKPDALFHTDAFFALSWGFLPTLTSYYAQALTVDIIGIAVSLLTGIIALQEITLSRYCKTIRREVDWAKLCLIKPERALKILVILTYVITVSFVVVHYL